MKSIIMYVRDFFIHLCFPNLNAFFVPPLSVLTLWQHDQKASGIKGNRTKIKNTKER